MITNAMLRQRYQELEKKEGLTLAEVASRVGWVTKNRRNGGLKPDSSRVARSLGLVTENGKARENINNEHAALICRALHVDPVDCGL